MSMGRGPEGAASASCGEADGVKSGSKAVTSACQRQALRQAAGRGQWIAAATMMLIPRHIAATTKARAWFCFSTISRHRS